MLGSKWTLACSWPKSLLEKQWLKRLGLLLHCYACCPPPFPLANSPNSEESHSEALCGKPTGNSGAGWRWLGTAASPSSPPLFALHQGTTSILVLCMCALWRSTGQWSSNGWPIEALVNLKKKRWKTVEKAIELSCKLYVDFVINFP